MSLPSLPVPSLKETCERYLISLKPLLNPQELKHVQHLVLDFLQTQGPLLQERLIAYAQQEQLKGRSWLESWWLLLAYLSWREPVLVHSNWFIIVQPHPWHGQLHLQVKRASGFISNLLDYKERIDASALQEPSKIPLCMHQYQRMFGITRIPRANADHLVQKANSNAIMVLVQNQIYICPIYDAKTNARVSIQALEQQLFRILAHVQSLKSDHIQVPMGVFTGTHRDFWTHWYDQLDRNQENHANFLKIQSTLFAVAFDDFEVGSKKNVDAFAQNVFHAFNGQNRWFDKSLTIVVTKDGMIGLNGEHSPCDALVPANMVDYCVQHEPAQNPPNCDLQNESLNEPQHLIWNTNPDILKALQEAQNFVNKVISDSDLTVLHFTDYGSDFIKKVGRVSPDAFVQMALQATYYRIHKKWAVTYETASTRKFHHGRTETCRSLSWDMQQFVSAFENYTLGSSEKFKSEVVTLFRKASEAHVATLTTASNGQGVDRHLLGLRMVLQPGETKHPLFTHPSFSKSSTWTLSTSALFSGERVWGTGFGCVDPKGYGMNYLIASDVIKVGIESKKSCVETSSARFKSTLQGVLLDFKNTT